MTAPPCLRLYTRKGCCLCEGLEERLRDLQPPPPLELVDVDEDPALQARYGLQVPVLALASGEAAAVQSVPAQPGGSRLAWRDLPPVPPRLTGGRLHAWLAGHGAVAGASAPGEHPAGGGL